MRTTRYILAAVMVLAGLLRPGPATTGGARPRDLAAVSPQARVELLALAGETVGLDVRNGPAGVRVRVCDPGAWSLLTAWAQRHGVPLAPQPGAAIGPANEAVVGDGAQRVVPPAQPLAALHDADAAVAPVRGLPALPEALPRPQSPAPDKPFAPRGPPVA